MEIKAVDYTQLTTSTPTPSPQGQQQENAQNQQAAVASDQQDQVQVDSKNLQNSLKFMNNLRAVSDEVNAYAKFVRHTDAVLEKASNQVELMKKPLESIIKNFPPFPAGSKERADLLKSYISLRKEIDKMSVPPPLDASTPALKQLFSDMFDKNGNFMAGSSLNLPETIPAEATDRQIIATIDKLDTAKMQIDRGRVELSSSVK